jgi:hypothetical protein
MINNGLVESSISYLNNIYADFMFTFNYAIFNVLI